MGHAPTDRRLSSQLPSEVNLAEMGVDIAESDKDRRLPMEGQIWCVSAVMYYGMGELRSTKRVTHNGAICVRLLQISSKECFSGSEIRRVINAAVACVSSSVGAVRSDLCSEAIV